MKHSDEAALQATLAAMKLAQAQGGAPDAALRIDRASIRSGGGQACFFEPVPQPTVVAAQGTPPAVAGGRIGVASG